MSGPNNQRSDYVPRRRLEREREARRHAERLLEEKARKLYEVQKARSRFLKNINHEFRTPLNGILGPAELLQHDGQPESVRHLAAMVEESAQQLLMLLEAAVDAARGPAVIDDGTSQAAAPLVLIVDDNSVNRLVAKAAVEAIGMRTTMAENGAEAIDMLSEQAPNAVLMDLQMPVMDGKAAIKAIRASDAHWHRVPIIVLTADAEPQGEEDCLSLGANGYMTKPVSVSGLQNMLQSAIAAPAMPFGEAY